MASLTPLVFLSYLSAAPGSFSASADDHLDLDPLPPPEPLSLRGKIWERIKDDCWVNVLCYGLAYAARWTILRHDHRSIIPEYVLTAALTWSILLPILEKLSSILNKNPPNPILLYCASNALGLYVLRLCKIEVPTLKESVILMCVFPVARVLNDIFAE